MKRWKKILIFLLRLFASLRISNLMARVMPSKPTASAAMSASALASVTSGPKYSAPLSRSQLSSLLRSDSVVLPRRIDLIVVHCSDTRADQDFTIQKLAACHKARGFGDYPGYHVYIRRDGTCYYCRPLRVKGCHVSGWNANSVGVCYEGGHLPIGSPRKYGDTRTQAQIVALQEVVATLRDCFPNARVVGHNELNPMKACPCLSQSAMKELSQAALLPQQCDNAPPIENPC